MNGNHGPDGRFIPAPDAAGPTLKEYFEKLNELHQIAHLEHSDAHAREHEFAQDAIKTAASLGRENKADANEWRGTMNDREKNFATKVDVSTLGAKIDDLQRSEIKRAERETIKFAADSEERRQDERRQSRQQWQVGIVVGLLTFFAALVTNFMIRLLVT